MKERRWEFDAIRIIACFCVVLIHVAGHGMGALEPASIPWIIRNQVTCMVRFAAPVFFMLSGVLFLNKEIEFSVLYRKYILRMVVAVVAWSGFYAVIDYLEFRKYGGEGIDFFFRQWLKGHYHMWFLPALVGAYVCYPMIRKVVAGCEERLVCYLGILICSTTVLKSTLDPFIKSDFWDIFWENIVIPDFTVGILYFTLGYCLYQYRKRISVKLCAAVYLTSAVLMAGINLLYVIINQENAAVTYGYLNVWTFLSSCAVFVGLVRVLEEKTVSEHMKRICSKVAECTFGVYLIHAFFIERVFKLIGLSQRSFPTGISIVLFSVLTFALSLLCAWMIKKLPYIGKRII